MLAELYHDSASMRRRRWLAIGLLILLTIVAYSNSLRGPFVYDDGPAIPGNPTIRHLWPLTDVLVPQSQGGLTVSGRPVLNLSFALNFAISGEAVWSYHAFNVLVHVGSALLVFGLVRRTLRRPPLQPRFGGAATELAFITAALWSLHPLQTQAVSYTVQRAESLMGFFYLLTLYAFARASDGQPGNDRACARIAWFAGSIGACAFGMATKEVMATAPLMVLLYDRTFVAGGFRAAWRQRRGYYFGLGATWLLLAALVVSTGGNRGGTVGVGVGVPWWAYGLTQFHAVARYLRLSVWPGPLIFEYGTFWVQGSGDILPFAAVVGPVLVATMIALRFWPVAGFLGAWFFGILAPTSLTPGTIQMIVEHRMYLSLAAVIATVVLGAHAWLGRKMWPAWAVVALVFSGLTFARNRDYQSHLALWQDTVAKRPDNPRAREGLAEAFTEIGRLDAAVVEQTEAARLKPDEPTYHYNVALLLVRTGRVDEAIRRFETSLRLKPDEPRAHNNLAIALVQAGRVADALPHYAEAERLEPSDAQFHYNHGLALSRLGRDAEAVARFEAAVRLRADFTDAHFNLAIGFARLGRLIEARREFETVLRLKPADADARRDLDQVRAVLNGTPD